MEVSRRGPAPLWKLSQVLESLQLKLDLACIADFDGVVERAKPAVRLEFDDASVVLGFRFQDRLLEAVHGARRTTELGCCVALGLPRFERLVEVLEPALDLRHLGPADQTFAETRTA